MRAAVCFDVSQQVIEKMAFTEKESDIIEKENDIIQAGMTPSLKRQSKDTQKSVLEVFEMTDNNGTNTECQTSLCYIHQFLHRIYLKMNSQTV